MKRKVDIDTIAEELNFSSEVDFKKVDTNPPENWLAYGLVLAWFSIIMTWSSSSVTLSKRTFPPPELLLFLLKNRHILPPEPLLYEKKALVRTPPLQ